MPRLDPVPRASADPRVQKLYDRVFGDRDPVREPGTATGTPGNWWTVLAWAPHVLEHAVAGFALWRSAECAVAPRLRELAMARAGFARGSQFVFSQHCKALRALGFSEAQIAALPAWAVATCFAPDERAVLAYTDELVLAGGRVQDGTFAELRAFLGEQPIVELTYLTLTYALHASMTRALRLEYDDVPERVVEIPAPGAALQTERQ